MKYRCVLNGSITPLTMSVSRKKMGQDEQLMMHLTTISTMILLVGSTVLPVELHFLIRPWLLCQRLRSHAAGANAQL